MTEPRRTPTMADVARAAGVSHQTVWRALSGAATVKADTRTRILAAAERLGYRPNQAARRLVQGRTGSIGILGPDAAEFGPTSSLFAVERAVRAAGYFPLIGSTAPDDARAALEFLLGQSIEALVVIASHRAIADALAEMRPDIPVVTLHAGSAAGGAGAHAVTIDQGQGIRLLVDHLAGLGHTRLQYLSGPPDFLEAQLRADAFRAAVRERGMPELPQLAGDWSPASGFAAIRDLDPGATALVCGNDQMALGAMHALAAAGRAVPQELSVVGFDDVPEAAHLLPPLTTVHQDFPAVGRRAVEVLVRML